MPFARGRLQLIPDTPDIVVHGAPREARCAVLSGRIVYLARSPRPICSLVVRFRPKHEELFNPALSVACQPEMCCVVVRDGRVSADSTELAIDECAGRQEWRFSMDIPGNISETVFTPSAFIAYELVAEIRTSPLAHLMPFCKQVCVVPIAVKRVPAAGSLWAAMADEPLDASATWRERIDMSAAAGSRIAHDAQSFRATGTLRPLVKGMCLLRAAFELRESTDGPFDSWGEGPPRGHTVAMCVRDLCAPAAPSARQDPMSVRCDFTPTTASRRPGIAIDQDVRISGTLRVPAAYGDVQYDIATGPVRVSHELVFSATVVDEAGQVHTVRLSTGVYVFPPGRAPLAELPRYENVAKDTLLAAGQYWGQAGSTTVESEGLPAHGPECQWLPPAYSLTCPGGSAALAAIPYTTGHLLGRNGSGSHSSSSSSSDAGTLPFAL
ncbi:hypothetical protein LPJ61_000450 [Coemansia biformis]|uniref:Arrestin-like N-terminal domain-containing protein n=1 Tax=Coemansia biformis TaxID=1286918 RepID=A0A9W7YBP9_9FUNG|nr:hypothetical protein LPJ61_000450 [Coemansia biformis]